MSDATIMNAEARLRIAEPALRGFAGAAALEADLPVDRIDDVLLAITTLVGMAGDAGAQSVAMTCGPSPRRLDIIVTALGGDGAVAICDDPRVDGVSVLRMLADTVEQQATRVRLTFASDRQHLTL